jgi:hypothetical protein
MLLDLACVACKNRTVMTCKNPTSVDVKSYVA